MKAEEIESQFDSIESIAIEYEGVECWIARELAPVMGYIIFLLPLMIPVITAFRISSRKYRNAPRPI